MKTPVAGDLRTIFNAQGKHEAEALLTRAVQKYKTTAPKLSARVEESLPDGLVIFAFPEPHRRLLETTNDVERVNPEVKRRT